MDNDIPFITLAQVENRRKISTNINKSKPIYNVKSSIPPYRKPSEVPNPARINRNSLQSKMKTQTPSSSFSNKEDNQTKSGKKMEKRSTFKTEYQKPIPDSKNNSYKSTTSPYRKYTPGNKEICKQDTVGDNSSGKKTHAKLSGSNTKIINRGDSDEPKHCRPQKAKSYFSEWLKNQKKLGLSKTNKGELLPVENEETKNSVINNKPDKETIIENKSVGAVTENFNDNRSESVTCKTKDTRKGKDQFTKKAPSLKKIIKSDIKITEQKIVLSSNTSNDCDLAILKNSEEKSLFSTTKTDHDVGRTRLTNTKKSLNKSDDDDIEIILITGKKKLSPNASVDCVTGKTLPHYQEKLSSKTTAGYDSGISPLDDRKNKSSLNKNRDIEMTAQSESFSPKRQTHCCSKKNVSHNEKKRSSLTNPEKVSPLKTTAGYNLGITCQRCHKREPYSRAHCCSLKYCQPELGCPPNEMEDFQMNMTEYEAWIADWMKTAAYKVKYEESLLKLHNNYHGHRPTSSRSWISPPQGRIRPCYGSNWGFSTVGGGWRHTTYEPRYKTNNYRNRPSSSQSWAPPPCGMKCHCYDEKWQCSGVHQDPRPDIFEPKYKNYFCMSHYISSEDE